MAASTSPRSTSSAAALPSADESARRCSPSGSFRPADLRTQGIEGLGSLALLVVLFVLVAPTASTYVLSAALAFFLAAAWAVLIVRRVVGGGLLRLDRVLAREALALGLRGQIGNVL